MTVKQRQCLLTYLGYNVGPIDGADGPKTRAAVTAFQGDFGGLTVDGIAGEATEKALRHAVAYGMPERKQESAGGAASTGASGGTGTFWDSIKYFKRSDPYIGCSCGRCGGFPVEPAEKLMRLADAVREAAGKPMIPTSTVRCDAHNAEVGGVKTSRHRLGHAMDFYIPGMSSAEILTIVRKQPDVVYCYAINDRCVHMDIGN